VADSVPALRGSAPDAATATFQPVPTSASAARRFVRDHLRGRSLEPLVDAATLAVSELVTNAALHAQTPLTVRVVPLDPGVRIEVSDASPVLPRPRQHSVDAALGRGLGMLDALGRWGVTSRADGASGKTVWFETTPEEAADDGRSREHPAAPPADPPPEGDVRGVLGRYDASPHPADDELVTVHLLRFPLQLFIIARTQHDELVREFTLMALTPAERGRPLPSRLLKLIDVLGRRYRGSAERADTVRDAAAARGELVMDLTYRVPRSARAGLLALDELMDAADEFCRSEQLLTLALRPVEHEFRRWFTGEFVRQIDGEPPTAWAGPLDPTAPWPPA
jgi:hypothetical protein